MTRARIFIDVTVTEGVADGVTDCYFHGPEPVTAETFIVCFECGHAWTADALIAADYEAQVDCFRLADVLDPGEPSPIAVRRLVEDIRSCPECIHDF